MRIYNDEPRPRALLESLSKDILADVRSLFPSFREVSRDSEVHEDEYDVLVTADTSIQRSAHLHAIAFGTTYIGLVKVPGLGSRISVRVGATTTLATELHVPDTIKGELGALVHSELVPYFSALSKKPIVALSTAYGGMVESLLDVPWCRPFLLAGDGNILAGVVERAAGGQCWILPAQDINHAAWISVALKELRVIDPERVPALPAWWERAEWATPEQRQARTLVRDLETERQRLVGELDLRLTEARNQIRIADDDAAQGMLRLLMADGDILVDAVKSVLQTFGFEVEDMDERFAPGARREDLRVRQPRNGNWEGIAEIKGYSRGAAVNDLARIARWSAHYAAAEGRMPSAQWHVVNAFKGQDPAVRPTALPDDNDLREFSVAGGLLVDTRQLFKAWSAIREGTLTREAIRESLTRSRGRWSIPQ